MTAFLHSYRPVGRGSRTPSPYDRRRADCGPRGTHGRPVQIPDRAPSSLLAHSSDVRNFDNASPQKSEKMAVGLFRPAARRLAVAFKPHRPPPCPVRAPCGVPSLAPKKRAVAETISPLAAPISFVRWSCGLLRGTGLGRKAPTPTPSRVLSAMRVGSAARGPEVVNPSSETRVSPACLKGP